MSTHTEKYIGCTIKIEDESNLSINNKNIDCGFDESENKWSSQYLPYYQFDSLLDLSKAIVRDSVEFTTARN